MTDTFEFVDAPVFDLPAPTEDDMPTSATEAIPFTSDITDSGLACETCGKPLEYGGRGRKPKYCDEHKAGRAATPRKASKRNDALAEEAAEVLNQINGLVGIGLLIAPKPFRMPQTAKALEERSDRFKEAAVDALKANPDLARSIARAGGVSGSAGLVIAYGVLAASLAPVAMNEWKGNMRERKGESAND